MKPLVSGDGGLPWRMTYLGEDSLLRLWIVDGAVAVVELSCEAFQRFDGDVFLGYLADVVPILELIHCQRAHLAKPLCRTVTGARAPATSRTAEPASAPEPPSQAISCKPVRPIPRVRSTLGPGDPSTVLGQSPVTASHQLGWWHRLAARQWSALPASWVSSPGMGALTDGGLVVCRRSGRARMRVARVAANWEPLGQIGGAHAGTVKGDDGLDLFAALGFSFEGERLGDRRGPFVSGEARDCSTSPSAPVPSSWSLS